MAQNGQLFSQALCALAIDRHLWLQVVTPIFDCVSKSLRVCFLAHTYALKGFCMQPSMRMCMLSIIQHAADHVSSSHARLIRWLPLVEQASCRKDILSGHA